MHMLVNPPINSIWEDTTLEITYQVKAIGKDYILVNCQHKSRRWTDGIDVSLFNTELTPVN
jgi:hypothetical protein